MLEVPVDYAPVQPPTEAYRDRAAAAQWRESFLPATAWRQSVRLVNLAGGTAYEVGALDAMIGPVIRGLAAGLYGQLALVVSAADAPVVRWVQGEAAISGAPVYVSASIGASTRAVSGPGALTATEVETLDAIRALGGRSTAADFARARGLDPAAANNRLANLERKRYLFRIARPRPRGDEFVDPGMVAEAMAAAVTRDLQPRSEVSVPPEVREAVTALAAKLGRLPEDVLADAWRHYFRSRQDTLTESVRRVRDQLRTGDTQGLMDSEGAHLGRWADEAAARLRRDE